MFHETQCTSDKFLMGENDKMKVIKIAVATTHIFQPLTKLVFCF